MWRTAIVTILDPMNMALGHINSSNLDLFAKKIGHLFIKQGCFSVEGRPVTCVCVSSYACTTLKVYLRTINEVSRGFQKL